MAGSKRAIPPKRLFKYRSFNTFTLRMLTEAELFYAAPFNFNDPMDCNPTLTIDISSRQMLVLLKTMLIPNVGIEKTRDTIARNKKQASFFADEGIGASEYFSRIFGGDILTELKSELGSIGVLSLSAVWDSPAMWSYYADEHRGLCIEYDTTDHTHRQIGKVSYSAPRAINLSDVYAWKVKGDLNALELIKQTYYYAKSSQWSHEREWRDLRSRYGAYDTLLPISAIHFGMRRDKSVKTSIVKLLYRQLSIKLYEVSPKDTGFNLRRDLVDRDKINESGITEPLYIMARRFSQLYGNDWTAGNGDDFDMA